MIDKILDSMNFFTIIPALAALIVGAYGVIEPTPIELNPPFERPAFMIIRVGWSSGVFGEIRDYPNMSECEAIAEHISKVRTPTPNEVIEGINGSWKFNFNRKQQRGSLEPIISTLCVPSIDELASVKEGLVQKKLYSSP